MECKLNGQSLAFEASPGTSAVEVIREQFKLTGTKKVCGQGACGACTVLLDGIPVLACLTPSEHLDGKTLNTVESYQHSGLHPVQKAFAANDALQCGFCTPGFVMQGIFLYDKYRSKTSIKPDRKVLAAALSGNLCRCGAYAGILDAMEQAIAGKYDDPDYLPDYPRVEALDKVTGKAVFTADIMLPQQMTGLMVRSTHPHARILSCNLEAARQFPGVEAVISLYEETDPVLRYVGQEICAIAAVDMPTAKKAAEKIHLELEPLPFVVDPSEAALPDSPLVYKGKEKNRAPNAAEGIVLPGKWKHNTRRPLVDLLSVFPRLASFRLKRAAKSKRSALFSTTFTTAAQIHTPFEPHCCVAHWEGEDKLRVFLSTQAVHWSAREIASIFGLKPENVKLTANHVGGGFGSKLDLGIEVPVSIKLAKITGTPVKVVFSRREEMMTGGYRPPTRIALSLAANRDRKKLKALSVKAETFSGIGINTLVGAMLRLVYPGMPRLIDERDVVSNLPSAKPFRGPSAPQSYWAMEQAIDAMALELGMTPLEARIQWDPNRLRQELFRKVGKLTLWQERQENGAQSGRFRTGIGMASGNWFNFFHPKTKVKVAVSAKGISVTTATQDIGTGSRSVLATVVAEVFGLPAATVNVYIGSSSSVQGPTSGGSRSTNSLYNSAKEAALEVRGKLEAAVKDKLGEELAFFGEAGIHTAKGQIDWKELFVKVPAISATVERGHNTPWNLLSRAPLGADDVAMGPGNLASVFVVKVVVDTLLSKIKVESVWGGIASGKIVVPELAKSQCYGGIIQGLSYALYEEREVDKSSGIPVNLNLENYHIAGIGDVPEMDLFFYEAGFEQHKGEVAGLGEISTIPVAAALGNAVFNALGATPRDLPLTIPRISALLSK